MEKPKIAARCLYRTKTRSAWEGPRIVKLYDAEDDLHQPTLVRVSGRTQLRLLGEAARRYARREGLWRMSLTEFLEARGFTVPSSYSAHWPYTNWPGE